MKEKPILFSTPMVQAILEGKKTQTRRVIIPQPIYGFCHEQEPGLWFWTERDADADMMGWWPGYDKGLRSKYQVSDILWVREAWQKVFDPEWEHDERSLSDLISNFRTIAKTEMSDTQGHRGTAYYVYRASDIQFRDSEIGINWRPSIHMPREAARLFLRVTGVRVERLQNISEMNALAEGINYVDYEMNMFSRSHFNYHEEVFNLESVVDSYKTLWNAINAKRSYGWDANPWVYVIEFERVGCSGECGV